MSPALMRGLRRPGVAAGAVAGLVATAILAVHAQSYLPYFVDDSFISLRYSDRLLHGHGLTWTDGERVEGYSNFLWVVAVAAGGAFFRDLVAVARALCFISTVGALFAVVFAYRPRRHRDALPVLIGATSIALAAPVGAWSIGGLEGPLFSCLVAWGLVLLFPIVDGEKPPTLRSVWPAGLCLSLASLTRPDGALLAGAAGLGLLLAGGIRFRFFRAALWLGVLVAATVLLHGVFRRLYYDDWFPNTYYAKVVLTEQRRREGIEYIVSALPYLGALVGTALLAVPWALFDRAARGRVLLVFLPLVAWAAYLVNIGGDMITGRRHWFVMVVLCGLLAADLFSRLVARGRLWVVAVIAAPLLFWHMARGALLDPQREYAHRDSWHWTGRPVGRFLQRAFLAANPLVAVDAAGALPFYAPKLRMLDMLGLNDRYLAHHPPQHMGHGLVGHELGDGAYLWRRKPDILVFHDAGGRDQAVWRSGVEMQRNRDFRRLYQLVTFVTPAPEPTRTVLWMRREDSSIGIQRSARRIEVPGFLLSAPHSNVVAGIGTHGAPAALLHPSQRARLDGLSVPVGHWHAELRGEGTGTSLLWVNDPLTGLPVEGPGTVDFDVPQGRIATVTLIITVSAEEPADIERIVLSRTD